VKLLVIGEGKSFYIEYLEKLISNLRISDNVIFYPWVKRTILPSFYSASDIGVWPGLSSISIVEAASTGLPIIIASYPVETFALENENGFAFKLGNVKELRKCLEILIYNDKLRKEMGRRSRLLVEQKLNWKAITTQYLNAYNLALNKS
jgi:glycosyltransferase involved in cell wall biosynthesis